MDHRASVSGAAATRCSASARAVRRRPRRGARDGVSRRVSCVDGREFGLRSAPPFGTLLTTRPSRSSRRLRSARCDRCRGNGIAHNNCMAGGGAAPRPVRPALLVNSVRLLRNRARASSAILLRRGGAIDQGARTMAWPETPSTSVATLPSPPDFRRGCAPRRPSQTAIDQTLLSHVLVALSQWLDARSLMPNTSAASSSVQTAPCRQ
jgi:hypothetical protein